MKAYLARMPLRVKLVAAAMVLVTVALAVIVGSSTLVFRQYLIKRIDDDLQTMSGQLSVLPLRELANQQQNQTLLQEVHVIESTPVMAWRFYPDNYMVKVVPDWLGSSQLPTTPSLASVQAHQSEAYTLPQRNGEDRWRALVTKQQDGGYLVVAQSMAGVGRSVTTLVFIELVSGLAVLILLAAVAVAMVRASLRPLTTIEHTAAAIAAGDLTQRVPDFEPQSVQPRTEVGRLGRALNVMLRQIEMSFSARALSERRARHSEERMRQFVADASHELRTPLTTIRGFAELYRQGAVRTPDQTADLLRRIEGEAQRMGLLVEDMLLLARLDQERPLSLGPMDLRVIASDALEAARAVAPDRTITLEVGSAGGPIVIAGDEARLRQVVGNLVTNAIVHTPAGSPVWLRLRRDGGEAVIEVADQGPGLTEEQAARVFERFYRVDAARTRRGSANRDGSGSGLGLAIVAALVTAHGGQVSVRTVPGQGCTFQVRLPLVVTEPVDRQAPPPPGDARWMAPGRANRAVGTDAGTDAGTVVAGGAVAGAAGGTVAGTANGHHGSADPAAAPSAAGADDAPGAGGSGDSGTGTSGGSGAGTDASGASGAGAGSGAGTERDGGVVDTVGDVAVSTGP